MVYTAAIVVAVVFVSHDSRRTDILMRREMAVIVGGALGRRWRLVLSSDGVWFLVREREDKEDNRKHKNKTS